jgi:hypothetical protein
MPLTRSLIAAGACAAALGLAACGGDDETTSATASPAGSESVSFVSPMDGTTVGHTITAKVDVSGFEIDADHVGEANESGHGHLHFSLDGGKYDYPKYSGANGDLAKQLGVEGMYSPSVKPAITYTGIPAGEHTLAVELANNDHSDTGVSASTTFEVG